MRLPAGIEVLSLVVANCFSIANPSGPAHSYLLSQPFAPRGRPVRRAENKLAPPSASATPTGSLRKRSLLGVRAHSHIAVGGPVHDLVHRLVAFRLSTRVCGA